MVLNTQGLSEPKLKKIKLRVLERDTHLQLLVTDIVKIGQVAEAGRRSEIWG